MHSYALVASWRNDSCFHLVELFFCEFTTTVFIQGFPRVLDEAGCDWRQKSLESLFWPASFPSKWYTFGSHIEWWNPLKFPSAKTCGRSLRFKATRTTIDNNLVKTWSWTRSMVVYLRLSRTPQYRMCKPMEVRSVLLFGSFVCFVHPWLDGPPGSHRKRRSKTARTPSPWGPCHKLQNWSTHHIGINQHVLVRRIFTSSNK